MRTINSNQSLFMHHASCVACLQLQQLATKDFFEKILVYGSLAKLAIAILLLSILSTSLTDYLYATTSEQQWEMD